MLIAVLLRECAPKAADLVNVSERTVRTPRAIDSPRTEFPRLQSTAPSSRKFQQTALAHLSSNQGRAFRYFSAQSMKQLTALTLPATAHEIFCGNSVLAGDLGMTLQTAMS